MREAPCSRSGDALSAAESRRRPAPGRATPTPTCAGSMPPTARSPPASTRIPARHSARHLISDHDAFQYLARRSASTSSAPSMPSRSTQAQPSSLRSGGVVDGHCHTAQMRAVLPGQSLPRHLAAGVAHATTARGDLTVSDGLGPTLLAQRHPTWACCARTPTRSPKRLQRRHVRCAAPRRAVSAWARVAGPRRRLGGGRSRRTSRHRPSPASGSGARTDGGGESTLFPARSASRRAGGHAATCGAARRAPQTSAHGSTSRWRRPRCRADRRAVRAGRRRSPSSLAERRTALRPGAHRLADPGRRRVGELSSSHGQHAAAGAGAHAGSADSYCSTSR